MRTNVAVKTPAPRTHEGAVAVRINPVQQLCRSVMANLLFEDQFYEDGVSIADRIQSEIVEVLKMPTGAQTVVEVACEARTAMKLRHVPLLLLVSLIRANTEKTRAVIAGGIVRVVQRPDELGELISLFWKVNGKRTMLPHQMKLGLAAAFQKFNAYELGKWNADSAAVKLRNCLFLCHAKPKDEEQAAVWKQLVDKTLQAPDTWEVNLSAGKDKKETFERLISEGKLGALALLRNLRGMREAGVPDATVRAALAGMKTDRVLPFRFISAAKYAPQMEPELEQAMFRCLESSEKLAGNTVLVVDNSGSMYGTPVSAKSEIDRSEAACALAMLLREVCEHVQIVVFSGSVKVIAPRRGFALRDAIKGATEHGATNTQNALFAAETLNYDRCIVITDEQSHQTITGPMPESKGYFINVASNQNGIGYREWVHIDGWSEAVVDWILKYESAKD